MGISANPTDVPRHSEIESFVLRGKSLDEDLSALSDLCVRIRLQHASAPAAVLSESIQRHVVRPLRRRLQSTSATRGRSQKPSALDAAYEERYLTRVAMRLLQGCCCMGLSEGNDDGSLPLAAVLDALLGCLHAEAHVDIACATIGAVWADVFSILAAHLGRWLRHGVVEDVAGEFFIATGEADAPTVIVRNLPSFVTRDMAAMLVFTGSAARCAHLLSSPMTATWSSTTKPSSKSCSTAAVTNVTAAADATVLHIELEPTFDRVRRSPLSAALILEAACVRWRAQAAQHLSDVLPFEHVGMRVRHLRDFLLLGHAPFWRCVFDDMRASERLALRNELSEEARQSAERTLNRLLSVAAVETGDILLAHFDNSENSECNTSAPLVLYVSRDCAVIPRFSLSLAESQVLSPRAAVYCDVFALTFTIRRTACELRAAFAHVFVLERRIRDDWSRVGPRFTSKPLRTTGRQRSTCVLVGAMELRRRMMCFVESVEWYVQAEVIQPKFDKLLALLDNHQRGDFNNLEVTSNPMRNQAFFDVVTTTHCTLMDDLFKQCFVSDDAINARLNAIVEVCLNLSQFLQNATVEAVLGRHFSNSIANMNQQFTRNVALFMQLLSMYQKKGESKVESLLFRLRYNLFGLQLQAI